MLNSLLPNLTRCAALLGLVCALPAPAPAQEDAPLPTLALKSAYPKINFKRPLCLEEAPDESHRCFLTEQAGRILILPADREGAETKTFFDITDRRPYQKDEEGLLGFAFHPKFKENRKFYVFYTQQDPKRSVISEFQASATDPGQADLKTERILLTIEKPYWNHNGGCLAFGPDGYLYISVGDSGDGKDPHNFGQSLNFLFAKILRIDVDHPDAKRPYGIPQDNPFTRANLPRNLPDTWSVRPETWAFGLRNVWRMSFDQKTGELWAADVGQDNYEEVDLILKGGNYGWSVAEAFHPFKETFAQPNLLEPVLEYGHSPQLVQESKFPKHPPGQSITGGFVYRGKKLPALAGVYVYADYVNGGVFGFRASGGKVTSYGTLVRPNPIRRIAGFGQDLAGEIYVLPFDGHIYDLVEPAAK